MQTHHHQRLSSIAHPPSLLVSALSCFVSRTRFWSACDTPSGLIVVRRQQSDKLQPRFHHVRFRPVDEVGKAITIADGFDYQAALTDLLYPSQVPRMTLGLASDACVRRVEVIQSSKTWHNDLRHFNIRCKHWALQSFAPIESRVYPGQRIRDTCKQLVYKIWHRCSQFRGRDLPLFQMLVIYS